MSTSLIPVDAQLPAHLQAAAAKAREQNTAALGGIRAGGFPRISIKGSKFSIVEDGVSTLLKDPNNTELPLMQLKGVIVGFNPGVSKTFYEGKWTEGDKDDPDCSSDDGVMPDPHITKPQASNCSSCPQNVWGSRVSEQGKQVKACSDNKRLVFISEHDLDKSKALDLSIKPGSLKEWAGYVRELDSRGFPVVGVITKIQFDPTASHPKLNFKFDRFLTPEESVVVDRRASSDEVRLIASPRKTAAATQPLNFVPPAATVAPPAPTPTAPAPAAPTPSAPTPVAQLDAFGGQPPHVKAAVNASGGLGSPAGDAVYKSLTGKDAPVAAVEPPKPVDPYDGQPAHVKPAVDASGGLGSPAGAAVYKALTGKDAPSAPAPAPVVEPPKPVDPFEGQPAHVKPAVDASGGIASTAGAAVYKALTGKDAPGKDAPAAEAPKRTRAKKADPAPAPAPTAPAAPAPSAVAPAAPPAQSFAAPAAGSLGANLDDLLAQAMATPTA